MLTYPPREFMFPDNPGVSTPALPLSLLNGGTGDDGGYWASYPGTVYTDTGAVGAYTSEIRLKRIGSLCFVYVALTVTSVGTAGGNVYVLLPIVPLLEGVIPGTSASGAHAGQSYTLAIYPSLARATVLYYTKSAPGIPNGLLNEQLIFCGVIQAT